MVEDDEEFGFIYAANHAYWKVQCRFRSQFRVLYFCGVFRMMTWQFLFYFSKHNDTCLVVPSGFVVQFAMQCLGGWRKYR